MQVTLSVIKRLIQTGAAGIIAKWGPYIKERYNVNPMRICADIIHHADAVRLAWYDDNEKVFLSINKKGVN